MYAYTVRTYTMLYMSFVHVVLFVFYKLSYGNIKTDTFTQIKQKQVSVNLCDVLPQIYSQISFVTSDKWQTSFYARKNLNEQTIRSANI